MGITRPYLLKEIVKDSLLKIIVWAIDRPKKEKCNCGGEISVDECISCGKLQIKTHKKNKERDR